MNSTQPPASSTPPADNSLAGKTRSAFDPLLGCLVALAQIHGQPTSPLTLTAGLPLENQQLTPALFARAAKRAGLKSNLIKRPLESLSDMLLPAVLLLHEKQACVLLGWSADGATARVILPELPESAIQIPRDDLVARYSGLALLARPGFRFDARTPEVGDVKHRHWFWGTIAENIPLYRDVLWAALFINLFALAVPVFTMNVYDRVVPNHALESLWMLALGVSLVLVLDTLLRTVRGYFIDLSSKRIDLKLSALIMERVLGMRLENRPLSVGSFASNLRAFETVRDFIASATVTTFVDVPFALLFLLVIAWISPWLVIPVVLGVLLVIGYALTVQHKMHELSETTYRASAQRNATLIESLVGLEAVKALGAEGWMQRKWEKSAAFLAQVSTQLRLLSSTAMNGSNWIQQMITIVVVVLGVYLINDRQLTMGGLIACSMLSGRTLAPLAQVAGLLTQYHNPATAMTSLNQLMEREVERPPGTNYIARQNLRGEIEFRDVTFQYPNQEMNVLNKVSFRIQPGERVAILGRVGSGKSTLQRLIMGLYQATEGSILIDGIDQRQLDPAELRRQIGYVPQDVSLFYGTLRENLILGESATEDADIVRAATIGGIAEYVNRHPKGFDMMIGERGESLSGGQRQAVAIARAVIHDAPILLLDEPTDSMDHSTEEEVKLRLRKFMVGKTALIVTHRTSLLELVDRIIVVDHGKIVADGPKATVVEALRQGRVGKGA